MWKLDQYPESLGTQGPFHKIDVKGGLHVCVCKCVWVPEQGIYE